MIKQKVLKLACKQARYGFSKIPHIFPMEHNIFTDKLPAAATVHLLWVKWFVHACHYKGFLCSNYKAKVNVKIVYSNAMPCLSNQIWHLDSPL